MTGKRKKVTKIRCNFKILPKSASILGPCKSFSGASSQTYIKLYNNRPGEQTFLEPHDHQIYT